MWFDQLLITATIGRLALCILTPFFTCSYIVALFIFLLRGHNTQAMNRY